MIAFESLKDLMKYSYKKILYEANEIKLSGWQGDREERIFLEYVGFHCRAKMIDNIDKLKILVKPSLPWADIHFEERVSGIPYNPPPSYKLWNSKSGDWMMNNNKIFSHTYPERMWPKSLIKKGIRFNFGDLNDLVDIIYENPDTRQAYMPMFIHEDLVASKKSERVPCSLGWHFIIRNEYIHTFYFLRSVDVIRHLHNDVYLAVRLTIWVKEKLLEKAKKDDNKIKIDFFNKIKMGFLDLSITSLHCFIEDKDYVKYRLDLFNSE